MKMKMERAFEILGMSLEKPPDSKFVTSIAMIILSTCGICLVWLNTWSKTSPDRKKALLNQMLWKFQHRSVEQMYLSEQRVSLLKLICAGIMVNSVVVSLLSKVINVARAVQVGYLFFIFWLAVLLFFWNLYTKSLQKQDIQENESKKSMSDPLWSNRSEVFKKSNKDDPRIPVTIVTGFLGSGKTTLVKRILANTIGLKILVIENEIGSEGIDHDLLLQSTQKEEIILLNNGCICCTVRNDLLTSFRQLFRNESFYRLDWIIIETTGLADPAPLIQSFYMDKECQQKMRIDGVLTVVDAKHFPSHLINRKRELTESTGAHGGISESILQVTFADRILLNKIDLVSKLEVESLIKSLKDINSLANIYTCSHSEVDLKLLFNIQAFDPKRFINLNYENSNSRPILINRDESGKILKKKTFLDFSNKAPNANSSHKPSIGTLSFTSEDPIDLDMFNEWISNLLQRRGQDIFRMKGIIHMKGFNEQFVCHAVHMIFDGERTNLWPKNSNRQSKIVFIGNNLSKEEIESGFRSTLA